MFSVILESVPCIRNYKKSFYSLKFLFFFFRPFKQKMNELLVCLLKIDAQERMTFPEFFDFVDDLMKSKVEVVNLLHGTSFKFMMEQGMT